MTERWRKSTRCDSNNCLEVAGDWRTSTYSAGNGNCVEVTSGRLSLSDVWIRDSKHPNDAILKFDVHVWRDFIRGVRNDEFKFGC